MHQPIAMSSKYYKPIIHSRHRYNVLYGGRSSAKSDTAAQKMAKFCRTEKGYKGVCLRKVFADIKDSQFDTIWSVIERNGWEDEFRYTKSPLTIRHEPTGNTILARGLDKPAKLKSIVNPTMVWIEEADEIKLDDFIKSDTSIRHPDPDVLLQMIITFNPESENGWINDYFFPPKVTYEKADGSHTYITSIKKNTLILHTTYVHNDFCSQGNIDVIKGLSALGIDSNYYRVYVLGLWGNALKGLVFENVKFPDKFPDRSECKLHGYSVDFGFTNDPTAILECALAHGELWFRVLTHKTGLHNIKNSQNPDAPSIQSELERNEVPKNELIIADCAEPKSISEIKSVGYNIKGVNKSKDTVEGSLAQMKGYPINIIGETMRKEVKAYKYAEDKEGNLTNKPIDAWNHDIDSGRYWFMENVMKPKFTFSCA